MIGAGLVARKAKERGLTVKPWVKTSLAPGSQVVSDYLERAGLQTDLDALGFNLVGDGCTTCISNGLCQEPIANAIEANDLSRWTKLSTSADAIHVAFKGMVHCRSQPES